MGHDQQQQPNRGQKPIQNDRSHLGKPQVFVQLSFGLSWSERHIPRSHNFSYTSKNLKNARDSGHFPRQPLPEHQQHRHRHHQEQPQRHSRGERHHSDHERPRGRASKSRSHHFAPLSPPEELRPDARRAAAHERGSSAPPPLPDARWGDDEGGPSATLFSRPARATVNAPALWKDLPTDPASFRLGEGLPWSVSAWPFDPDNDEHEPPFANIPTVVPLSPLSKRRGEDPQRVKELASLSTAMMTVDNGFENQWWNQGERQSVAVVTIPPLSDAANEDDARPMSMADAALLSAAEPPSAAETFSANTEGFGGVVSPISDFSPTFSIPRPFQRSFTSRSDDELWMGR